jgi:hypothetical protein
MEMLLLQRQLLLHPSLRPRLSLLVPAAPLMTALDMHGFSITLLPLSPLWEQALLATVEVAAWPGCHRLPVPTVNNAAVVPVVRLHRPLSSPIVAPATAWKKSEKDLQEAAYVRRLLEAAATSVLDNKRSLNELDRHVWPNT